MNLKFNLNKVKELIVYFLLFFAAMNFQAKFFDFVFISFFIFIMIQKKIFISQESLFYFILSIFIAMCDSSKGMSSIIISMAFFLLYIMGYNMMIVKSKNNIDYNNIKIIEKKAYCLLLVIACGTFTHYMLNFFINFNLEIGRNTTDVWIGGIMAATGQAALACLMLAMSVSMVIAPKKKFYRIIGVTSILCILAYDLVIASRTIFVMFIILLIIGLIYITRTTKNTYKKVKQFIELFVCILIIFVCIKLNIGGVQEIIMNSTLYNRLDFFTNDFINEPSRTQAKIQFILNAYKYPFGGFNLLNQYGYAHDLLLDGYDEYGLMGFILLVMILFISIRRVYYLIRYTEYNNEFKLTILCVYTVLLLEFYVEPILSGMRWLFCCYCLINGCVSGMNRSTLTVNSMKKENIELT